MALPPTNLRTSEETPYSFRVSWTPPAESVDRYRVEYYPADGGPRKEVSTGHPILLFLFMFVYTTDFAESSAGR